MTFGPRRGHVMFIFERFFRDFGLLLAALVLYLIVRDLQIILDNGALIVVVLFAPVKRLIEYLCTYYTVDSQRLLVESGWLKKKKQEVPIANITTVDFTQTFFFQLTGVYSLSVETASSIGSGPSGTVKLVLKDRDAVFVKQLLLAETAQGGESLQNKSKQEEIHREERNHGQEFPCRGARISEDISGNTIMASAGEIFLMGLLRSKAVIVVQLIFYGCAAASILAKIFLHRDIDGQQMLLNYLLHLSAPLMIAGLLAACYIIGTAVSVALSCIKYYGFRVTDRDASIFIEYGLLTKKTHTLMKDKISGISYSQSVLMRLFKRGTLEVFAAGYGGIDDNNQVETAVLYPILREEKLDAFLMRFLPEIGEKELVKKAEPKAFPYFFICGRFVFAVFAAAGMLASLAAVPAEMELVRACMVIGSMLIIVLAVCSVVLEYGNSALSGNETIIVLVNGGYTKTTVMLKTEKVEFIEDRATMRKRQRKNLSNIRLGLLAETSQQHFVRNMDRRIFEYIKQRLVY